MTISSFFKTKTRLSYLKRRLGDVGLTSRARDVGATSTSASFHTSTASANSPSAVVGGDSPQDLAIEGARKAKESVRASLPRSLADEERDCVAPFRRDEIVLGPLLGSGEFSDVFEVRSFRLRKDAEGIASKTEESEQRLRMKERETYRQTKNARYALKHIKGSHLKDSLRPGGDPSAYVQAARDLSLEAEILASLNHPNIIKLRGATHSGAAGFGEGPSGYFLIIDRLFETLYERLSSWRIPDPSTKVRRSFIGRRFSWDERQADQHPEAGVKLELTDDMMDERLSIALQISAAVMYMHSHSIIFRDLKPANIGFDVRGDVKIFDFGLARIMPEGGRHYDETYEMSGAGSPRYMAPECLGLEAYNMKADTYSFAIILWEMLADRLPYEFARTMRQLVDHVVANDGRPEIREGWPARIKGVLESSFSSHIRTRPEMGSVLHEIKRTLTSSRGGDGAELSHDFLNRRRSVLSFGLEKTISREMGMLASSDFQQLSAPA